MISVRLNEEVVPRDFEARLGLASVLRDDLASVDRWALMLFLRALLLLCWLLLKLAHVFDLGSVLFLDLEADKRELLATLLLFVLQRADLLLFLAFGHHPRLVLLKFFFVALFSNHQPPHA